MKKSIKDYLEVLLNDFFVRSSGGLSERNSGELSGGIREIFPKSNTWKIFCSTNGAFYGRWHEEDLGKISSKFRGISKEILDRFFSVFLGRFGGVSDQPWMYFYKNPSREFLEEPREKKSQGVPTEFL